MDDHQFQLVAFTNTQIQNINTKICKYINTQHTKSTQIRKYKNIKMQKYKIAPSAGLSGMLSSALLLRATLANKQKKTRFVFFLKSMWDRSLAFLG